jgi:peptidoglycan/xylan/chitin deacetylase (PgdA/CDA1 family)
LRPGRILLLHDGWSGPGDEDRSQTVAALTEIIRNARARGLEFVTVEQMMREEEQL